MKYGLIAALLLAGSISALFLPSSTTPAAEQSATRPPRTNAAPVRPNPTAPPAAASTNAAAPAKSDAATPASQPAAPPAEATATAVPPGSAPPRPTAPGQPSPLGAVQTKPEDEPLGPNEEIQVSFQGANVDMIVQWLAKTTGKSVIKHPRVQCQLNIVSSKKLPVRDAVNLVYRALSLEGFSAIESSRAILIVPEGQEPKMNPELLDASQTDVPEGRQRLIKVFPLKHTQPAEIRDKIRAVLSDKAATEIDERANQLIITDYNDNIRLAGELIKELDVTSVSDAVVEIFTLKYSQAEDMASLLILILNAQGASPAASAPSAAPGPPPSAGPSPGMPPGISIGPSVRSSSSRPPSVISSSGGASGGGGAGAGPQTGQQIKIWPDKTANRLIVSTPKSRVPEVKKLIEILDVDKPADVSVRVIPLRIVNAEDLVREVAPLYQKLGGKSVRDIVEVTASSRANALIILSSEANYKALANLISQLDTQDAQEKVTRAFQLKNADAEDVAKQLQELSQDQSGYSRYVYYFYSPSGQSSKKLSVVADRRRNTVIVQAPPASMDGIAKLVQELDEPVGENALAPKIFQLKYVSAVDLEDVLNELFLKKTQQRSYYYFFDDYPQDTADRNVGRLYGKVRITSEPFSNSLIVTANSPEHLAAVEDIIKQLDAPSQAGESTLRVGLRFAKANTVANSINILFAKNGSPPLRQTPQPGQPNVTPQQPRQSQADASLSKFDLEQESNEESYFPWLGGPPDNTRSTDGRTVRPVSDLVGRVRVVPDQRSNSLLISANVHYFPQILKLIEDLDAPTAEVLIEARIIEVSSDLLDKLGVRWSPDGSKVFSNSDYDNSFLLRNKGEYTKGFGGTTAVSGFSPASLASAISSIRSGVLDSTISMDFLVQFLRQNTAATVLAQPQINIKDNETGKLFVGQLVPVPDNNQINQLGGQNTTLRYQEVGVVLEVTPHINNTGDVSLKIHAESSSLVPGQTVLGGVVIDTRNFKTDLEARSGETLVLGGIIQKQVTDTLRKTPILGSIPGLGWAFKKKDKITREVELMVFLRPKVVRTPAEAKELLEEMDRKMPLIRGWKESKDSEKKP